MYYINIIYTKNGLLENRDGRVCVGRMSKGGDVDVNKRQRVGISTTNPLSHSSSKVRARDG